MILQTRDRRQTEMMTSYALKYPSHHYCNHHAYASQNEERKERERKRCRIYRVKCKDCKSEYIGQALRNVRSRMKEHDRDQKTGSQQTALGAHCAENGRVGQKTQLFEKTHKTRVFWFFSGVFQKLCFFKKRPAKYAIF